VHAPAPGDQKAHVREVGHEAPGRWAARVEAEDSLEGPLRLRHDADLAEARGPQTFHRHVPQVLVRLRDDHAVRTEDRGEEGRGISAPGADDEHAPVRVRLEEVEGRDEAPGGGHRGPPQIRQDRKRHVRVREDGERGREERFLANGQEGTF